MHSKTVEFFLDSTIEIRLNVPMAHYSSVKIGGEAAIVAFPKNEADLINSIRFLHDNSIKYRLVGRMTNILPKDEYYDGVVVSTRKIKGIQLNGELITAECGVTLPTLVNTALAHSLGGAEALSGIPGSIGGAIYSNAGAFGSEISDFIVDARLYSIEGAEHLTLTSEELAFSYRNSALKGSKMVLLSARLRFCPSTRENIKNKLGEVKTRRAMTQPLEYPSLGSVFKRCGGMSAAKLIDECGLKGFTIGGASVSLKHSGFIVNLGGATEKDFNDLIALIKKTVFDKFSVRLTEEIEHL